jgi:battenin
MISLEGISGGLAYVNVFYRLNQDDDDDGDAKEEEERGRMFSTDERLARKEFRIACVGFADTLGILTASLASSGIEPWLCGLQLKRGRTLCKEV